MDDLALPDKACEGEERAGFWPLGGECVGFG